MRLWSIHPSYLDAKGLVALWREALLAQKVLQGNTQGYRHHSQLTRFKNTGHPEGAIAVYLRYVFDEADKRGYKFNRDKIIKKRTGKKINVTHGQVEYEFRHLLKKLAYRNPDMYKELKTNKTIKLHPLFKKIDGEIEKWEIIQPD